MTGGSGAAGGRGQAKARPEARDSAPVGTAHGLHLPGILPEPDVILAQGGELTAAERRVLDDLGAALPEDAAPGSEASGPGADDAEVAELPRQRAQLPWWYSLVLFGPAAAGLLLAAALAGHPPAVRLAYLALGAALVGLTVKAWRARGPRPQPSTP